MKHMLKLAILALAALAFAAGASCEKPPAVSRATSTFAPSRLAVTGTSEQMGRQVGKQFGPQMKVMHPIFLGAAIVMSQHTKAGLYAKAGEIAKHIAADEIDEMRGLADGSGLPYEDVLFLNTYYSLTSSAVFCRQLASWGRNADGGELIHGRNLDWPDYPGQPLQRNNLILNLKPIQGLEHLTLGWPGMVGVVTGTNRHGITVAFNQLGGPRVKQPAEPTFFTLRRVLRSCKTAEEAVKLMQEAKPMDNGAVIISDATAKTAVVLEVVEGKVGVRKAAKDEDMICAANHPTTDAVPENRRTGPADWPLCQVARRLGKPLTPDSMKKCLADRDVIQDINMLSVVFLPSANKMLLSCGRMRAAEGPFTEYKLFESCAPTPRERR